MAYQRNYFRIIGYQEKKSKEEMLEIRLAAENEYICGTYSIISGAKSAYNEISDKPRF